MDKSEYGTYFEKKVKNMVSIHLETILTYFGITVITKFCQHEMESDSAEGHQ